METAVIISALAAAAGSANSIEQGRQAQRRANQAANGQRQAADRMLQDQQSQQAKDEATRLAIEARKRQRMDQMQSQGRAGTILTAPGDSMTLGNMTQGMGKTLLGQ